MRVFGSMIFNKRATFFSDIEKDCEAIREKSLRKTSSVDGYYVIDPDGSGPVQPFKVFCEFIKEAGITIVSLPTIIVSNRILYWCYLC